ncbi:hypothetical protein [Streptomyces sp. NPDC002644]
MSEQQPRGEAVPFADLRRRLDTEMDQIAGQLRALALTKERLQSLLDAVLAITGELDGRDDLAILALRLTEG